MKKLIFILGIISVFAFASVGMAVPNLQIDLSDGTYDYVSESVTTAQGDFTVYALLSNADYLGDDFFLSVAVYPGVAYEDPAPILGSFNYSYTSNGTTYSNSIDVATDMYWGHAPLEGFEDAIKDGGDLSPHDVYPTYFMELGFTFTGSGTTDTYNVQDNPGSFGIDTDIGTSNYVAFNFTDAYLIDGFNLHFDLYNKAIKKYDTNIPFENQDFDVSLFAPFSHDGQTRVPEPSTLVLLGIGILGVAVYRRKMT